MNPYKLLSRKVRISGTISFSTAFHIGSGTEGETSSDMGVLRNHNGFPILPGSSIKGLFRSQSEKLAVYLSMTACLLDAKLSEIKCVNSDKDCRDSVYDKIKVMKNEREKFDFLQQNTCDICKLFGSPMQASRIFFSDGNLTKGDHRVMVRDGVVIDRDSETARDGLKYDYEVIDAETAFGIVIDIENPNDNELALIGAVVAEWENGFRIGGFTSRGLGLAKLEGTKVEEVDYDDAEQRKAYLLKREMTPKDSLLKDRLEKQLNG